MDNEPRGISNVDIRLVLDLVDERVTLGSAQPIDTAMLPLVAAEIAILQLKTNWPYKEDISETIKRVRKNAKIIGHKALEDFKKNIQST